MEKTITVTIKVTESAASFGFLEGESGDWTRIDIEDETKAEYYAKKIGHELLSWVSLMRDELAEQN